MVVVYLDFDGWVKKAAIPYECMERRVVQVSFEQPFALAPPEDRKPIKDSFTCYDFVYTGRLINGYQVFAFSSGNPMRIVT